MLQLFSLQRTQTVLISFTTYYTIASKDYGGLEVTRQNTTDPPTTEQKTRFTLTFQNTKQRFSKHDSENIFDKGDKISAEPRLS